MKSEIYRLGGREGKILYADEPADLDTMYHVVHNECCSKIRSEQRNALFILVVFTRIPNGQSEYCLKEDGWYPIHDRKKMQIASEWHAHQGVAIHCPHQEEFVIPTGISTSELIHRAREQTGIRAARVGPPSRGDQHILNNAVEKFTPDIIQPSGYSLLIPAMEMHVKMTVPDSHYGTGGVLHRRTW